MASPEAAAPEKTERTTGPIALVVDDDADTRASFAELLAANGYQVSALEDGQKAFERLTHEPLPDVVVLDLWMPVMDGWTLANQVVAGELPRVPIIVVTAAGAQFGDPVPVRPSKADRQCPIPSPRERAGRPKARTEHSRRVRGSI